MNSPTTDHSTFTVAVQNVAGGNPALPGANGVVNLYSTPSSPAIIRNTDANGVAVFPDMVNASGYFIKVYHNPNPATIFGTEFWGQRSGITLPGDSSISFTRNYPYISESIKVFNGTANVTGQSVFPGTPLSYKVTVKNPGTASQYVKVRLVLDQDKVSPYAMDMFSLPQSIPANSSATYSFTNTSSVSGILYAAAGVQLYTTNIPDYTDGTAWTQEPLITIAGNLTVTFPNGGEVFPLSSNVMIRWTDNGTENENVKIELYKNGAYSKTIAASVVSKPGPDSISWVVAPNTASAQAVDYRIKITSLANTLNNDLSNANFIINQGGHSIVFNGITWDISNGRRTPGAGCNYWFDGYINGSNVYNLVSLDALGNLHVKIIKIGDSWYCPELTSRYHYGYGEYRFYVNSDMNFDPNVVAGLFNYESDSKEIDLKFHHWADSPGCSEFEGNYIIQHAPNTCTSPLPGQVNWHNFETPADPLTTHKYTWTNGSVHFQSYKGNAAVQATPADAIADWTPTCPASWIPEPGASHVMINFWMTAPKPLGNVTVQEMVINAVQVPKPDMVIASATTTQTIIPPSAPVTVNFQTKNKGNGQAGASITKIYFSTDNVFSTNDVEIGSVPETALNPGDTANHTVTCALPTTSSTGPRYLIIYADRTNLVPEEADETNNWTIIPITVGITYSTLTVNVHNVAGGNPALPGITGEVQLLRANSTVLMTATTDVNGVAVFTNVPSGTYYYIKVYRNPINPTTIFGKEYWGEMSGISIFSNMTIDFTRNYPYESEPIHVFNSLGQDVTGQVVLTNSVLTFKTVVKNPNTLSKNVKSRLVLDNDMTAPYSYDQESAVKTILPNTAQEFTFTWNPTAPGSYFAVPGTKTGLTTSSFTVTDGWAWPNAPTIIVAVPTSNLSVIVHNVTGGSATLPGINGLVRLYSANGSLLASQSTNSSNVAVFPNVPNGTGYFIKVYNNTPSTIFGQEYWGAKTGITITGSQTIEFTRNQPYELESIKVYKNSVDVTGQTVLPGSVLTFVTKVKNPGTASIAVKSRLVIDQDALTPYNFDQESPTAATVAANSTATFSFTFTPTQSGSYFATCGTKAYLSGTYVVTDGWEWPAGPIITIGGGTSAVLTVNVQNADSTSYPKPGAHGVVYLFHADNSGQVALVATANTNPNGVAAFQNVTNGSGYSIKVYYNPDPTTIFGQEYWGTKTDITVIGSQTITFVRNLPFAQGGVKIYDGTAEVTGQTLPPGTYTLKTTIKNPNAANQYVKVRFVADQNRSTPFDSDQTSTISSIPAGTTAVISVPITFNSEKVGAYYMVAGTITLVTTSGTLTDGLPWPTAPAISIDPGCTVTAIFPSTNLVPTSIWQTINYPGAGYYSNFYVTQGISYTWSLCPTEGASASYDSELSLKKAAGDSILAYNNDAICNNTPGTNARITWTATFTGMVRLTLSQYHCQFNSLSTVLVYKKNAKDSYIGPDIQESYCTVYPNPTSGKVTVDFGETGLTNATYVLMNMQGTKMNGYRISHDGVKDVLDLSSFPAGVYMLRIVTNAGSELRKVVVEK